jgi:predicted esterase
MKNNFDSAKDLVDTFYYDDEKRIPYYVYNPKHGEGIPIEKRQLFVLIHSSGREPLDYIEKFQSFADENNLVLLAPLFTEDCTNPPNEANYKFVKFNQFRFDQIVLEMIHRASRIYNFDEEKFVMHGFSGGGQFVHRFYYTQPQKLTAVSIGAPGIATFIDDSENWYAGTADFNQIFNQSIDFVQMKQVPVQLIVGGNDTDDSFMSDHDEYREKYGKSRLQRMKHLEENYRKFGIEVHFDEIEGVGHNGLHDQIIKKVEDFFIQYL